MRSTTIFRRAFVFLIAAVAALSSVAPASAEEDNHRLIHRSIQELVTAQGTLCWPQPDGSAGCFLFFPPAANYILFVVTPTLMVAAVDYAGLEDRWLKQASNGHRSFHTSFSGTVTERPLSDGRAEIKFNLHTKHAASRAFLLADGTPLFGYTTPEILAGAQPALGESTFEFAFIQPHVGMPLPDLGQVGFAPIPGQEFEWSHFRSVTTGPLRAGFGVADGTRGRMRVDMISTAANPSVKEIIDLRVIKDD